MDYRQKEEQKRLAALEAETAINDEVRRMHLEYAELSTTIRELLGKVYIRGGMEAMKKLKATAPHVQQDNQNQPR